MLRNNYLLIIKKKKKKKKKKKRKKSLSFYININQLFINIQYFIIV